MHVLLTHQSGDHPPLVVGVVALAGPQTRSRLATILWPDSSNARANLRVALYRLQRGPYADAVRVSDDLVELAEDTVVDALETLRLSAEGDVESALSASTAELMPWVDARDAGPGSWLASQRRRWLDTYVDLLRRAMTQAEESGNLPLARRHARSWVALSPHSEIAHRAGLRLAVISGDDSEARRLWSDVEAMTSAVHGRSPAPSTRAWVSALEPERSRALTGPTWPVMGRSSLIAELGRSGPTLLTTTPGLGGSQVLTELARTREHRLLVQGRAAVGALVCLGVALREQAAPGRHTSQALAALASGDTGERTRASFVGAVLETIGPNGVLALDDMHLFDQASLDVIAGVLRTIERAPAGQQPIVVGTSFRQDLEREPLAGWLRLAQGTHRMRVRSLEPLTRSDVAAILTHVLGGPPSREALSALWGITSGYPGIIDLTLRYWQAEQALLPDDQGGWSLDVERALALPLPPAGVSLVRSRVDVLGRQRRRILDVCLCLDEARPGVVPDSEIVMAVTGDSRWDVVETLEYLERSGFTHGGVTILGPYAAPLLAELPDPTHRAIHRTIAETLISSGAGSDVVARHQGLAGDDAKAARSWLDHARACRRRARWAEFIESSARALEIGLSRTDELACHLERFDVLVSVGDGPGSRAELVAARPHATTPEERAPILVREARVHLSDGAYPNAMATIDGLLDRFPEGTHVPEARLIRGIALARTGQLDQARVELERCREQHAPDDTVRDQEAARVLVELEMAAGRLDVASALVPDLVRVTALVGYPYIAGMTEGTIARLEAMSGRHDTALDHAARWVRIAREHGFRGMEALALVLHASVRLERGEYAESLASFLQALADITPDQQAVVQANIGTCYLHLGQADRAFTHYEAAIHDADVRGEPLKAARRRIALTEARLRLGVPVTAHEIEALRAADEKVGSPLATWISDLSAHAALLRDELTPELVAAVVEHRVAPDETERRDYVLAACALALGQDDEAVDLARRQPTSMRMVAIEELVTGRRTVNVPTGAAADRLVLAHVRGLHGSADDEAEAAQLLDEFEEAWPQHDGSLRRLLAFHTRVFERRGTLRATPGTQDDSIGLNLLTFQGRDPL